MLVVPHFSSPKTVMLTGRTTLLPSWRQDHPLTERNLQRRRRKYGDGRLLPAMGARAKV